MSREEALLARLMPPACMHGGSKGCMLLQLGLSAPPNHSLLCHRFALQRFGKKWHWHPSEKRKTRGDVCACE